MNTKRSRSTNWDDEEKQLFRSILKEYKHIIENKSLNTSTIKMKTRAWEEVHKKFNELNHRQRKLVQLKIQWKSMKVKARKTCSSFKNVTNKTGGGARPATDDSVIEVKDPAELLKDHNPYDSDGLVNSSSTNEVLAPISGTCASISLQDIKSLVVHYPAKKIISCQENPQDSNAQKCTPLGDHEYNSTIISHSKKLKDEEHRRRMEMAEEEHRIKIKIHQEKLQCVILEREILELRKMHEGKLTDMVQ